MNCLNCNSETTGSYCYNCGQKTSTTRFSFKHIFKTDIANKFYSFFKNDLFFTLKELATRPGFSVREYIEGKRVNHMNYMSLYLLLSAAGIFLDKYAKVTEAVLNTNDDDSAKAISKYYEFVRDNPKTFIFITIPVVSVFTFLFFKKSKFNFSEHLIMNVYKASAVLVITKIVTLLSILTSNLTFLKIVNDLFGYVVFGYSVWFLYQFFYDNKIYSKLSIFSRTALSVLLGMLFSTIFMFIYWLIEFAITGQKIF
ncbi:DUF3667 domain-containing protein [Flavobacterium nackdongense]|uniref:DUF3667 domain-containing protein n=1 Tax=Flavobacterium nackdongense TaxID=2547394 RepID=A0A4P6YIV1_9FLAO|nr:DUF3667 domain-containing protein [Flavobacterium nackdongense]QBN20433.1 DUF3667 domain-containing protein [Flavobacterium nackdongense]